MLLSLALLLYVSLGAVSAETLVFHEDFEGPATGFVFSEKSGWRYSDSTTANRSYNNTRFMEASEAEGGKWFGGYFRSRTAETTEYLTIPEDAGRPYLSFFYRANFDHDQQVDIYLRSVKKKCFWFFCWQEKTERRVARIGHRDNTGKFHKWQKIDLSRFRGREVKLVFKKWGYAPYGPGSFLMDDLRVGTLPDEDTDKDNIPDAYDPTPQGEILPPVENVSLLQQGPSYVRISWDRMDRPDIAGYRIFRREKGKKKKEIIAGRKDPLSAGDDTFFDLKVRDGKTYFYWVVGVDIFGREGESAQVPASVTVHLSEPARMPFVEHFDRPANQFLIPTAQGWGIGESQGEWESFSANRHLDSRPGEDSDLEEPREGKQVRAIMATSVHIPRHARRPAVSFWYKADLNGLRDNGFYGRSWWWKPDYSDKWPSMENHVAVDIIANNRVYKNVKIFHKWPPETEYRWAKISLNRFRGKTVCVVIRQQAAAGYPGKFIMDDFRISQLPREDYNYNGIPDEYETPAGDGMLPFVKNFAGEALDTGGVKLTWKPIDAWDYPDLAGYNIYRKEKDAPGAALKINEAPLDSGLTEWIDRNVTNNTEYSYFMKAVSSEGGEGYATDTVIVMAVNPIPVIMAQPQSLTVDERQPALFRIEAQGPDLSFQWFRDDTLIPDAVSDEYLIPSAAVSDSGARFHCVVTNTGGSVASDPAVLTVERVAPVITKHPEDKTVVEKNSVSFSVGYTGTNVIVQWYKDGDIIEGSTGATYTIENTPLSDNGALFKCIITNEAGSAASNEALLTVRRAPPVIVEHPKGQTVDEFGPVSFSVKYTGDLVSFQWQKDEQDIPGATESVYHIPETLYDRDDNGRFRCVVSNDGGRVVSNEALLSVRIRPVRILAQPQDISVSTGDPAAFSVAVKGSSYTIQWQRFQEDIPGAEAVQYKIGATRWADNQSRFTCVITNPAGTVSSRQALLTVTDTVMPSLTVDPLPETGQETDMVTVTGLASDNESGIQRVYILSDRFTGREFDAIVGDIGAFTADIPLDVGENQLIVNAMDEAGNTVSKTVSIEFIAPQIPIITIASPAHGSIVEQETVDVTGTVLSSYSGDNIRMTLGGQVVFPAGAEPEYNFVFRNIRLNQGPNTLTIKADTPGGDALEHVTVTYDPDGPDPEEPADPPELAITAYAPEITISDAEYVVSGTAQSPAGIREVLVNGVQTATTGEGETLSFEYTIENVCASAGSEGYAVEVKAVANDDGENIRTFKLFCDNQGPEIFLTSLTPDTVNPVMQNPFTLEGMVTDARFASLLINDQAVATLPVGGDTYSFKIGVPLNRGEDKILDIKAFDFAGNLNSIQCTLNLAAALDVEIITPEENSTVIRQGDTDPVAVTVRAFGLAETDQVFVSLDSQPQVQFAPSGNTATGTVAVTSFSKTHTLTAQVKDSTGSVLGSKTVSFKFADIGDLPLEVIRTEPAGQAASVEPSAFIAWYFSRQINPDLVSVSVRETAHGQVYEKVAGGTGLTGLSRQKLIDVHKDNAQVPGGLSWLPEKTILAFYPDQDFTYGGQVRATLTYDGQEISRTSFRIRSMPTLIQGFVSNQFSLPAVGMTVTIPEAGKTAVTDKEGSFTFGFNEKEGAMIPPGRYKLMINPGLENMNYGTIEQWITVEQGRLNSLGVISTPLLNPAVEFSFLGTGTQYRFDGNKLALDMTDAELVFPDGQTGGHVHVQMVNTAQVPYKALTSASGPFLYNIQPAGIEVAGQVHIELNLPEMNQSHDYLQYLTDYMLITGLDSESLQIVPVGAGTIDRENKKLTGTAGPSLKRMDYIGYAFVPQTHAEDVEQYIKGSLTMEELTSRLESDR